MPGALTEVTELGTALGTLGVHPEHRGWRRPAELAQVPTPVWERLRASCAAHEAAFTTALENGAAFLEAPEGLRGRRPALIEWKGPHRPPGDDVLPADLRIDHVYLVSCKYLSRVLVNSGPARLFERLLAGEQRSADNWFARAAPGPYQDFYLAARRCVADPALPLTPDALDVAAQRRLRSALGARQLPEELRPAWGELTDAVAQASAARWRQALTTPRARLQLLWRLLRVGQATYFVLGSDGAASLRLRVASTWDWHQRFDLRDLEVTPRLAGQPEVAWRAAVRDRTSGVTEEILGHVEIRWSHGRFVGTPEAKVYLDTPHAAVPGYEPLGAPPGPRIRPAPAPVSAPALFPLEAPPGEKR